MSVTKQHLLKTLQKGYHLDTRSLTQFRPVSVAYGVAPFSAEGSARVRIGNTEVVAGVKMELATPYPDTPAQGGIIIGVELLPLSNREYEAGPPSIDAVELSRVVDRGIRESHYIDFKKLCVIPGEKVWNVLIDIYPLNVDGSLFDACSLAALAALKNARYPTLKEDGTIDYKTKTDKTLPLSKFFIPVGCTVFKMGSTLFVDPAHDEVSHADARLTVVSLDDGNLCALQKGGDLPFSVDEILTAIDLAVEKSKELRGAL